MQEFCNTGIEEGGERNIMDESEVENVAEPQDEMTRRSRIDRTRRRTNIEESQEQ